MTLFLISDIKRLIGLKYDDAKVQYFKTHLPYNVRSRSNEIEIVFSWSNGCQSCLTPVGIYTIILSKIKDSIMDKYKEVEEIYAVITVPAFFNDLQRAATLKAAEHAGFKTCKLLNEPTAIAVCYFYEYRNFEKDEYYLFYDLGGGTFDVAICRPTCQEFYTITTDAYFGGYDFDFIIFRHLCGSLVKQTSFDIAWLSNKVILRHLQIEAQRIKENLSLHDQYTVSFKDFLPRNIHDLTITRDEFEIMVEPLLKKTIEIVDNFLKEANFPKFVIKKVLVHGGLARIPKIQYLLAQYFGRNILENCSNTNCVAQGAALYARKILRRSQFIRKKSILCVTTSCIAIQLQMSDVMMIVIDKNSSLPCVQMINISTLRIMENNYQFEIFETEGADFRNNKILTTVKVRYMTATYPDKSEVFIELFINVYGIISISAKEECLGKTNTLHLEYNKAQISAKF